MRILLVVAIIEACLIPFVLIFLVQRKIQKFKADGLSSYLLSLLSFGISLVLFSCFFIGNEETYLDSNSTVNYINVLLFVGIIYLTASIYWFIKSWKSRLKQRN